MTATVTIVYDYFERSLVGKVSKADIESLKIYRWEVAWKMLLWMLFKGQQHAHSYRSSANITEEHFHRRNRDCLHNEV
jgi:hypothetical protein